MAQQPTADTEIKMTSREHNIAETALRRLADSRSSFPATHSAQATMRRSASLARRAVVTATVRNSRGSVQYAGGRPLARRSTSCATFASHGTTAGCECCSITGTPAASSSLSVGRSSTNFGALYQRQVECLRANGHSYGGGSASRRWASSSSSQTNASDGNPTATTTTPLSEVSADDLQLAAAAALEPDSDQHQEQDQSQPSQTPKHDHLSDIPGAQAGGGKKLAIVFTCTVCSTRSAKKFSEQAYNHGVVLVRCPGCQNLHLIADRLGFFTDDEIDGDGDGSGWDIQKALEKRGDDIVAVTDDNVLELTMADVLGKEKFDAVVGGGGVVGDDESRSSNGGDSKK